MPLAFALLTLGIWIMYSGFEGLSLIEVLQGKKGQSLNPGISPSTDTSGGDSSGGANSSGSNVDTNTHGTRIIDGKPVAAWIVPIVIFARNNGWGGKVTSGWRNPNQVVVPSPGLPVAPQGQSNHNKTIWPGGAIDVSDPDGFESAISTFPGGPPLRRDPSINDPIHFSVSGR